jgi:hypothetical protein
MMSQLMNPPIPMTNVTATCHVPVGTVHVDIRVTPHTTTATVPRLSRRPRQIDCAAISIK